MHSVPIDAGVNQWGRMTLANKPAPPIRPLPNAADASHLTALHHHLGDVRASSWIPAALVDDDGLFRLHVNYTRRQRSPGIYVFRRQDACGEHLGTRHIPLEAPPVTSPARITTPAPGVPPSDG